jgi:hypothetical protein
MRIRCGGKSFTEQLPSDSHGIIDVFTGRYQATDVPSRDRCMATVLHVTICSSRIYLLTSTSAQLQEWLHYK